MTNMWEATVEAQIRSAQERGEFDNLPGAGKPIPGRNLPYDESWWIKSFMEREKLPSDLLLPTPLQLRRRVERVPDEVRELPTEQAVRDFCALLNTEIMAWLRLPTGPRVVVRPVNVDAVVRRWRDERRAAVTSRTPPTATQTGRTPRRAWWPWRRRSAA
ncbi:DUF1992 domain-containing protein [Micromonospora sp. 15K316]|uniref:DnaJ family domain-containing protein n=1 Tax=Micromonospora sp. 15K316 TaxID=2530376 RepID=UPI00105142ED|nr:DUF1992 domain-containing protein [Micromonospora sp. 15K316]TDC37553.1 DUF1992 domain-containing protein [Micromonospora sp. 15K316]